MNKLTAFVAGTALAALAAGCTDTANTNTNAANANSNTAVVVNNNGNANTSGVTTTNANTANTNANSSTRASYNANITREEYEKDKDRYGQEAKSAGDKVGSTATDGWLWVKTKAALTAVDDLRDSTINVDVEDGVITLRGNVASADQVKKADAAAKGIEGKKSVKNMLKVAAGGGNTNANANASKSNTNTNTH
ncbi:MAG TPA: BON domain-containing protein [Pyrinomonadaceae bacterium]|nr:BON domain-containing protein [Pyrinomonadaceae bacterium]